MNGRACVSLTTGTSAATVGCRLATATLAVAVRAAAYVLALHS